MNSHKKNTDQNSSEEDRFHYSSQNLMINSMNLATNNQQNLNKTVVIGGHRDNTLVKLNDYSREMFKIVNFKSFTKIMIEFEAKDENRGGFTIKKDEPNFEFEVTNKNDFSWPECLIANIFNEHNKVVATTKVHPIKPKEKTIIQFKLKPEDPLPSMIVMQIKVTDEEKKIKYLSKKITKFVKVMDD